MSEVYTPDVWVIVKFSGKDVNDGEPLYKVLAGWYGGFTNGDSWKLNSGITRIVIHEKHYSIEGYSGSVYECHKESERMSGIMGSTYQHFVGQAKDSEEDIVIEIVPIESILEMFK